LFVSAEIPTKWFGKPTLRECICAIPTKRNHDAWQCPHCSKTGQRTATTRFAKLPQILIIILNRFVNDAQTFMFKETRVNYALKMDLSDLTQDPNDQYELIGVMKIDGNQKYKAFAYREDLKSWMFFSESNIILTRPEKAVLADGAAFFVYEKIGAM
jgi:ubiquitin C-terminal hydrolase